MFAHLLLAFGSASAAVYLWAVAGVGHGVAGGFCALSLWQVYCVASQARQRAASVVLRLGGFS